MNYSTPDVSSLFQTAHEEGDISAASLNVLNIADVGAAIQGALGVNVSVVQAGETMLVTVVPDDSGSIRFVSGNAQAVREGHNGVIAALKGSKQTSNILAQCRYLNGTVLYPFVPLDQAVLMTAQNYNPNLGTPLYDQAVLVLGTVIAKCQEFIDNGQVPRSATLFVTDGKDEHSPVYAGGKGTTPDQVRTLVTDLLRQERHIVAAMGISDGYTDFYQVFSGWNQKEVLAAKAKNELDDMEPKGGMGIWPKWVLTPGNTPSEIRRAFQVFSQSAVRASQAAGTNFSKVAMGGLGGFGE